MVSRREAVVGLFVVLGALMACAAASKHGVTTVTLTNAGHVTEQKSKGADCELQIYRSRAGLAPHVALASLVYQDPDGDPGNEQTLAESDLHYEACQLGAEAIVITEEHYSKTSGATVSAEAVVFEGEGEPTEEAPPKPGKTSGTCFAVRGDGTLLTAAHVVEGARTIEVHFPDRDKSAAKLVTSSEG